MVSGSMRVPSPALNQPLKSAHQTRLDSMACASGSRVRLGSAPFLARHHQPGALDDLADGAGGRPRSPRMIALQNPLQLPRTPAHMRLPQLQHGTLDLRAGLVGMTLRRPVQFLQSPQPVLTEPAQHHIPGLARDPEPAAQLPHGGLFALILKDKAQLLFHHTARFPGHEDVVRPHALGCSVRNVPGSKCQRSARSVPPRPPTPLPPVKL